MSGSTLFYCTSAHLGGAERVALDVANSLPKNANSKVIFLLPDLGPIASAQSSCDIEFVVLPFIGVEKISFANHKQFLILFLKLPHVIVYFYRLLKILKINDVKTVYTHGRKAAIFALIARGFLNFQFILHLHQFPVSGWMGRIEKLVVKRMHRAIATSKSVATAFQQQYGVNNIVTIYPLISKKNYFNVGKKVAQEKLQLPLVSEVPTVGMITAIAPWKGLSVFIDALKILKDKNFEFQALIVGDILYKTAGHKDYLEALHNQVAKNGLTTDVFFRPFQIDAKIAYSALDVLVHASLSPEPFGRVISEARLCDIPVVASMGGGVNEQVVDDISGVLIPSGRSDLLANAMEKVLQNSELRKIITSNGNTWVHEHLNDERFLSEIAAFFK